jgi:hypothetical protein
MGGFPEEPPMGLEAECRATWGRKAAAGKARLEEKEIAFRGAFALKIPLDQVKRAEARAGRLEVEWGKKDKAAFELGSASEKWALKIRYPKSRLDKLGVKPESRVSVLKVPDPTFARELEERGVGVSNRLLKDSDLVFLAVERRDDLSSLRSLRAAIRKNGAVWVLWPKGRKELREDDVRAAALASGLVDVKVVSFSETLSGLRLVIPVAQR